MAGAKAAAKARRQLLGRRKKCRFDFNLLAAYCHRQNRLGSQFRALNRRSHLRGGLARKMPIRVTSVAEINEHVRMIGDAAERTREALFSKESTGIAFLKAIKFDPIGWHPTEGRALNCIEQVNQTFTYLAAFEAARFLLERHPEAGGFDLAPGAHMAMELDVMSVKPGLVGAETFAAVDPRNNRKLAKDIAKLGQCSQLYRYVFFSSPLYPGLQRWEKLEQHGIEVWSVAV